MNGLDGQALWCSEWALRLCEYRGVHYKGATNVRVFPGTALKVSGNYPPLLSDWVGVYQHSLCIKRAAFLNKASIEEVGIQN